MARAANGQAIRPSRRTPQQLRLLRALIDESKKDDDLEQWRRAKAVLRYIEGRRVIALSEEIGVTRGSINRWLQWFDRQGTTGLRTRISPGPAPRLNTDQLDELAGVIEAGPQSVGFSSGMWTGPIVGEWIYRRFGIRYHTQYVPALLHKIGFSVQRRRRRLARADRERQALWLRETLPRIKKKPQPAAG